MHGTIFVCVGFSLVQVCGQFCDDSTMVRSHDKFTDGGREPAIVSCIDRKGGVRFRSGFGRLGICPALPYSPDRDPNRVEPAPRRAVALEQFRVERVAHITHVGWREWLGLPPSPIRSSPVQPSGDLIRRPLRALT